MNPTDLPANMQAKIAVEDGCWLWTGALNSRGYSCVTNGKGRSVLAHRRAYELLVGEIPEGLTIDHLCMVKRCVNPEHLEPVTIAENVRRALVLKSHCVRGHPLYGDNLQVKVRPNGGRQRVCITCRREHSRAYRAARQLEAVSAS